MSVVPVVHDKWLGEEGENNNKKTIFVCKESRSPSIEQQKIVKEGEEKRNLFGKRRSEEGKEQVAKKNPGNKITGKRRQGMRFSKNACSGL